MHTLPQRAVDTHTYEENINCLVLQVPQYLSEDPRTADMIIGSFQYCKSPIYNKKT